MPFIQKFFFHNRWRKKTGEHWNILTEVHWENGNESGNGNGNVGDDEVAAVLKYRSEDEHWAAKIVIEIFNTRPVIHF